MMNLAQLLISKQQPTLLLTSRMGTLYNLTPSNQSNVQAVQLSVGDFLHLRDVIGQLPQGMSFKKYLAYKDSVLLYLSPHDYYKEKCMSGCFQEDQIKVFSNKGYIKLSSKEYYEFAALTRPEIWVGFTQMPLLINGASDLSNKSIKRAIKKSVKFLEQIKGYQKIGVFLAPIHGCTTQHFEYSITEVLNYKDIIDGFLLCDIPSTTTNQQIRDILKTLRQYTQGEGYLVCLAGNGHIDRIQLFRDDIHLFETNYPFELAQKNMSLIRDTGKFQTKVPAQLHTLAPLDQKCKCPTCNNYSQSYIAHLVKCNEMTANVLLTIHNLHQYQDLTL